MKIHKQMANQEIASLLRAVAAAYEVKGESIFRIRAYENAADSIEHASREVKDLWEEGKLSELPGIGGNIASHLSELFQSGSVKHFKEVFKNLPRGMFELLEIPGIGPKTAYKLSKHFGITKAKGAVPRLKKAALQGKIRGLEGFAEDKESAILKGIEEYERREHRMPLPEASNLAQEFIAYMKKEKAVLRIDPLGSLRRRTATVGDVDLAVACNDAKRVINHFIKFPKTRQVLAAGENTARLIHISGRQVDVKTEAPQRYGSLLQHFTGSKNHNIHLRELALTRGQSVSEHGIKEKGKLREFATEEDFYQALKLSWIPPELREDAGEIEAAMEGTIPTLVRSEDIRGDLHVHTNYGWKSSHDAGINSMKEMIEKAIELGYEYIGIGDHNPSTSNYSPNQIINEVSKRSKVIEDLRYSYENKSENRTIKILNTLEVDILVDGKLAVPEEALKHLDYLVVSIHSSMRMSMQKMTERIISGLSHSKSKILGHPTGRLLERRESYEVDWERIFRFAKSNQKYLEINAWPERLDLPDLLVRRATEFGVQLVINTDAHAREHLDLMSYGVDVARRGWATSKTIVNTKGFSELKKLLIVKE